VIGQFWNPVTAAGHAALDAVITRHAQIIAYIDDYKLLMIATLAAAPLLVVFTKPSRDVAPDHTQAPCATQYRSGARPAHRSQDQRAFRRSNLDVFVRPSGEDLPPGTDQPSAELGDDPGHFSTDGAMAALTAI
jgi:hypothetical protein